LVTTHSAEINIQFHSACINRLSIIIWPVTSLLL
jgi:hypothetical protein